MGSILIGNIISDNAIFYSLSLYRIESYRLHSWILIPATYTVQHVLFDADKLVFGMDAQYQAPQQYIAARLSKLVARSGILSLMVLISSPLLYYVIGWSMFLPIATQFQLILLSFLIFIQFEIINVTFNAHMSIGCLHKGKPISSLSPSPIETLVSGLSSKKPFPKLTAFQELSYRATSNDMSLRLPIYSSEFKNTNSWSNILTECIQVIKTNNENVNKYLNGLENTMSTQNGNNKAIKNETHQHTNLFGNNQSSVFNGDIRSEYAFDDLNHNNSNNLSAHRISLQDDDILLRERKNPIGHNSGSYLNNNIADFRNNNIGLDSYRSYNETIITRDPKIILFLKSVVNNIKNGIVSFFFPANGNKKDLQLSLFDIWYVNKNRQAEKLVPLAVCHMESVISLMGFLIKAIDESPKGSVVASVGEVLSHLEKSVAILGKYSEWKPEGHIKQLRGIDDSNGEATRSNDMISLLYELSISAFLEIVLKYNVLLNDVYLDEDVIKLSKWVLDMCAEE
ncbi:hypothetical protein C6P45_003262 [Maudiozyma exigua]|uniref:Nucleoporin NDC1 n=1 Tax=Maudiozyma exigua TaxID=34358 RepID=A0A9P6WE61_MAUEX|nr:hypothetical protein C6P45_003262 [Kazachstania exigua]